VQVALYLNGSTQPWAAAFCKALPATALPAITPLRTTAKRSVRTGGGRGSERSQEAKQLLMPSDAESLLAQQPAHVVSAVIDAHPVLGHWRLPLLDQKLAALPACARAAACDGIVRRAGGCAEIGASSLEHMKRALVALASTAALAKLTIHADELAGCRLLTPTPDHESVYSEQPERWLWELAKLRQDMLAPAAPALARLVQVTALELRAATAHAPSALAALPELVDLALIGTPAASDYMAMLGTFASYYHGDAYGDEERAGARAVAVAVLRVRRVSAQDPACVLLAMCRCAALAVAAMRAEMPQSRALASRGSQRSSAPAASARCRPAGSSGLRARPHLP
jgi:hypothetical protein